MKTLLAEDVSTSQRLARRISGISGISAAALATVIGPLYFIYSGNPPTWDVLTRNLLNLVAAGFVILFLAGLRSVLREAGPAHEWLASLVFGAGLIYATIVLVKISLEVGVVLGTPSGTTDPTIDGPVAHANILMEGSVTRLVIAILLGAAGYAIARTRTLPRWVGWSAYLLAVVNLAFVPSLYFGINPGHFYSAIGWGTTALVAGLFTYWAAAAGVAAMLGEPVAHTAA